MVLLEGNDHAKTVWGKRVYILPSISVHILTPTNGSAGMSLGNTLYIAT